MSRMRELIKGTTLANTRMQRSLRDLFLLIYVLQRLLALSRNVVTLGFMTCAWAGCQHNVVKAICQQLRHKLSSLN